MMIKERVPAKNTENEVEHKERAENDERHEVKDVELHVAVGVVRLQDSTVSQ